MKKVLVLITIIGAMLFASTASAAFMDIFENDQAVEFKYKNWELVYEPVDQLTPLEVLAGNPTEVTNFADFLNPGLHIAGVLQMTRIEQGGVGIWGDVGSTDSITGFFYDLTLAAASVDTATDTAVLYWSGGVMDIYYNETIPSATLDPTYDPGAVDPFETGGLADFTIDANRVLHLTMDPAYMFGGVGYAMRSTLALLDPNDDNNYVGFDLNDANASFFASVDINVGNGSSFNNNLYGPLGSDFAAQVNWSDPASGYQFTSDDPVDSYVVPEPSTYMLMGLGLLLSFLFVQRRRAS